MPKFTSKPAFVTAVQYIGDNFDEIISEFEIKGFEAKYIKLNIHSLTGAPFIIRSKDGNVIIYKNDWIVKFPNGEYEGIKDSIFQTLFKEG